MYMWWKQQEPHEVFEWTSRPEEKGFFIIKNLFYADIVRTFEDAGWRNYTLAMIINSE